MLETTLEVARSITDQNRERLIIIDKIFPSLFTGFLIAEFSSILRHFPSAIVYSTVSTRREFRDYASLYPELASRVRRFSTALRLKGAAAYVVFLNNIVEYLEKIEAAQLPFAFELYPGGGFCLDNPTGDAKLARVFASPMFRKVIVTQNITRDYLLDKNFCREDQIKLVFGVVVPTNILRDAPGRRLRYGVDKLTFDICFVAHKYLPRGIDKGYDRFLASARILSKTHPEVRFHVVGGFTEEDGGVTDFRDKITFYGRRATTFFPEFHAGMDIILSPNVPSTFGPGYFDGFPTGCCVEAALYGTAMFATDELKLNAGYLKDREEIVIISREPSEIAEVVEEYISNPERLKLLAKDGQVAIRRLFALDAQMAPRLRVLSELLEGANHTLKYSEQLTTVCAGETS
jgi:glycosyltransferase involved in cell wall biosynthesis